jgi:hypothetical protein
VGGWLVPEGQRHKAQPDEDDEEEAGEQDIGAVVVKLALDSAQTRADWDGALLLPRPGGDIDTNSGRRWGGAGLIHIHTVGT